MNLKQFLDSVDAACEMGEQAGYRAWPDENVTSDDWVAAMLFFDKWNKREERLMRLVYTEAFANGGTRRRDEVERMRTDLDRCPVDPDDVPS